MSVLTLRVKAFKRGIQSPNCSSGVRQDYSCSQKKCNYQFYPPTPSYKIFPLNPIVLRINITGEFIDLRITSPPLCFPDMQYVYTVCCCILISTRLVLDVESYKCSRMSYDSFPTITAEDYITPNAPLEATCHNNKVMHGV